MIERILLLADHVTGKPKKQKFLHGAAILTAGTILTKIIGALYKIPLNRIIGTEGFGHFNMAYNIFNVLLTISTAGLPIALSRMISEASALNNRRQIQHIYRVSLRIFLGMGLVSSAFMLFLSPALARFMRDPGAVYSIAALSPAVLFLCLSSSLRGYFQGQQYMTPTAVSQILEALSKLVLGLGAVYVFLRLGFGTAQTAGAAIAGVTAGSVFSALYLILVYRRKHLVLTAHDLAQPVEDSGVTARRLLALAIPITLGAAGIQIFNALDSMIIQSRLQDSLGLSTSAATSLFGTYSAAQTFYMLPPSLIQPLAIGIIPAVTAALTTRQEQEARRVAESAIRMTALIALPCGAGLAILASPIQALVYGYDRQTLETAGPILALLGCAVIFHCMVTVTNAILQAHGYVYIPIYTTLAGGVVNLFLHIVLVSRFGITGAAIATICYCGIIMFLNIAALHKRLTHPPRILVIFVRPMAATALMAAGAYLSYEAVIAHTGSLLISVGLSIAAACLIYAVMILSMGVITWDDCMLLPNGQKIARLLHINHD